MTDNRAHSELGASISARWIACPGSVALSRGQEQTDNIHAQAGRAAHHVAEMCLTKQVNADAYLGEMIQVTPDVSVEVDEEMVYSVQRFVDYCRSILAPQPWIPALNSTPSVMTNYHWIERPFNLESLGRPDMYGTADFVVYDPELKQLEVVDLKYGQGVLVEVKGNPQLRYYGLGAALLLGKEVEIDTVKITVVQPRMSHPDGAVRSETISYFDLLEFAGDLLAAAKKTDEPDAPLVTGSQCRFCPALAICPAARAESQAIAQVAFSAMPVDRPPVPETLPDEILDDLLSKAPLLDDWLKALTAEATRRLRAGRDLPGFKLVERRATRKWKDPAAVTEWLLDEKGLFPEEFNKEPELKSPAQIEKLVGKKNLPADLVVKESSGYKLAPITDPRPALALSPGDAFLALPPGDE